MPPIRVRTGAGEVAGFLRETGGARTGGFVPLTFPVRWLALPAVRGLILQLIGGQGFLPVQEGQSFAYEHELRIETDYVLDIEARRAAKPPRLILRMAVSTGQGEICAHLETVLRIVPLNLEPAS
ncbi:MAG: hypothetical protein DLM68_05220 [Hyphomicrobiales bacterium]|nr:MAG: hypothetical protein DLM68_05220 [Hyphomicrobiales bacterium]